LPPLFFDTNFYVNRAKLGVPIPLEKSSARYSLTSSDAARLFADTLLSHL